MKGTEFREMDGKTELRRLDLADIDVLDLDLSSDKENDAKL